MRRAALGIVTALALLTGSAMAQQPLTPPPLEAFARLPAADSPKLSPDGQHVAFLASVGGRRMLVVKTLLAGPQPADDRVIAPEEGDIRWFTWAKNDRLLIGVGGTGERIRSVRFTRDFSGALNSPSLNLPGVQVKKVLTEERRLLAVDLDGGNAREIGRRKPFDNLSDALLGDMVLSILPDDPDNILMMMQEDRFSPPSVARVNVRTGDRTTIQNSRPYVTRWVVAADGTVRAGMKIRDSVATIIVRGPDGEWMDIGSADLTKGQEMRVLGGPRDPDILYVASRHESDRWALYTYSIAKRGFVGKLAEHPRYDIDGLASLDGVPVGATFLGDLPEQILFDPQDQQTLAAIDKAVPNSRETIASRSRDGRYLIIISRGPTVPPRYHLFDRQTGGLSALGEAYPELSGQVLGRRSYAAYPARDGTAIPAYITLPPGREARQLPFVILPHGGPASRDGLGFDWMAQFLASRGYGVIQPNFRGSTGYGKAFEQAGRGQWGGLMQDDLVDAARFLTGQGLADPGRLCMVGASYGGYAALVAGFRDPGLFRCVVSINGVADLTALFDDARYSQMRDATRASFGRDRDAVERLSPKARAAEFTVPVLLVHGTDDTVVPADDSRDMATILGRYGKPHRLELIDGGSHWLTTAQERIAVLKAVEAFLAEQMGPPS